MGKCKLPVEQNLGNSWPPCLHVCMCTYIGRTPGKGMFTYEGKSISKRPVNEKAMTIFKKYSISPLHQQYRSLLAGEYPQLSGMLSLASTSCCEHAVTLS